MGFKSCVRYLEDNAFKSLMFDDLQFIDVDLTSLQKLCLIFIKQCLQIAYVWWSSIQSLHPVVEYHGVALAVGGCAIYVQ